MPMQAEEVTYAVQEQSEGDDLTWTTCLNRDSQAAALSAVELFKRRCSPRRFRVLRISKVTTIDVVETFEPSRPVRS